MADIYVIYIDSSEVLLNEYMTVEAMLNSNLFGNNLPTDNLIEGRLFFRRVPESQTISNEEVNN